MTREVDPGFVARLAAAGVPTPASDARLLGTVAAERGLGSDTLEQWIERRSRREPLQLIVGVAWFREVEIALTPGVFIPRPETEVVAGIAIDAARRSGPAPIVVEPCTGTGAIACALVTEVPGVRVLATEIDLVAARLATANIGAALAGELGVPAAPEASATFHGGSLLDPIETGLAGLVDVIVSNPPYLPADDIGSWEAEVADNDPVIALVGGRHGNEVVDELASLATAWLRPGGTLVVELDPRLAAEAAEHARSVGLVDVAIAKDLAGRDRVLVARRAT